jgi:hypothetical protein
MGPLSGPEDQMTGWPLARLETRLRSAVHLPDLDEVHDGAEHGPQGHDVDRDRRDVENKKRQDPSDRENSG